MRMPRQLSKKQNLDKLVVHVRKEYSKVKKARILPISPVTAAAIGEVINMTPEEWGNMIFYSRSSPKCAVKTVLLYWSMFV